MKYESTYRIFYFYYLYRQNNVHVKNAFNKLLKKKICRGKF